MWCHIYRPVFNYLGLRHLTIWARINVQPSINLSIKLIYCPCCWTPIQSVWPDLTKFGYLDRLLKSLAIKGLPDFYWAKFWIHFGKFLMFIVLNCQIWNKKSSHLVTLNPICVVTCMLACVRNCGWKTETFAAWRKGFNLSQAFTCFQINLDRHFGLSHFLTSSKYSFFSFRESFRIQSRLGRSWIVF